MKVMALLMVMTMMLGLISAVYASESSKNKTIQLAANKYTSYTHKVTSDTCQDKRKEINNRCLYKHKMGKKFCANQDAKNSAICDDLDRRTKEHHEQQAQKEKERQAAEEKFNQCVKVSDCDKKENESATKMCYEHCEKSSLPQ